MNTKFAYTFYRQENSDALSDDFFHVNNCGYYVGINKDMVLRRPGGRKDYQLIYVHKGQMVFSDGRTETAAPAGSLWLYEPGKPQFYASKKENNTSYYWIHFSGTHAEEILNGLSIKGGVQTVGIKENFVSYIKQMVRIAATENHVLRLTGTAICALSCFEEKSDKYKRMSHVVRKMAEDMEIGENNRDYAIFCGMSKYHFIRVFNAEYGMTPHAYFVHLKIEKSKFLLRETNMSIGDISQILYFDDPLYFSKVFKKETGLSPRAWRRNELLSC